MNVISGAVDNQRPTAHFVDYAAEISEKVGADIGFD